MADSNARISQVVREVVSQPTTQKARVSQVVREVVAKPTTQQVRISQVVREVVIKLGGPPQKLAMFLK